MWAVAVVGEEWVCSVIMSESMREDGHRLFPPGPSRAGMGGIRGEVGGPIGWECDHRGTSLPRGGCR